MNTAINALDLTQTIDSFFGLHQYLKAVLSFSVIVPSAVLCYLPMRHKLKYSVGRTALIVGVGVSVLVLLCAFVSLYLVGSSYEDFIFAVSLVICFAAFKLTTTADMVKTVFVFVSITSLISFPSIFAYMFDSVINPTLSPASNTWELNLIQFGLCALLGAIVAYPLYSYCAWIVDNISFHNIWYAAVAFPLVILAMNIYSVPVSYANMQVGGIWVKSMLVLGVLLVLYILFYYFIYIICKNLTDKAALNEQNKILEMQKNHHEFLQTYLQETAELRHDFKHSVHAMQVLAEQGNIEELKKHILEYDRKLNIESPKNFCSNGALNALLNYYDHAAQAAGIVTKWKLNIPKTDKIDELDLCSLMGNIIENAIEGCKTLEKGEKYFNLTAEEYDNCLYIVSTNNFGGRVRKENGVYLSTKGNRRGMGLLSVQGVAKRYGGIVEVDNSDREFMVNVMLRL